MTRAGRPAGPTTRGWVRSSAAWPTVASAIAIVVVLISPGFAVGPSDRSRLVDAPPVAPIRAVHALIPFSEPSSPSKASVAIPLSPSNCSAITSGWRLLYGSGPAPPAVAGSSEPGCVPGPDEEGVTLASNQTNSASKFEVTVSLPTLAASAPSSFDQFWLSVLVRGVSCSLDGQSVLRIDFAPPGSPIGVSGGWAVQAPVWGLDPAGACDPRCQNTTAYYDIAGHGFCLDNTLVKGVGSRGGIQPLFAPGDTLRVTVTDGSGQGLTVYANDTTRPVLSTSWAYPKGVLVDNGSVEPFGAVSQASSGWTFGGSVGFGWTNCPTIDDGGAPSCDSYNGAIDAALSFPTITGSTFWNASASLYNGRFTSFDPWSSSGACAGDPNVTACYDFLGNGGSGAYPGIHLSAGGGTAWIAYGSNTSSTVGTLASSRPEFASDGTSTPNDPAIVGDLSASVNGTAIVLSARATDPRGIGNVAFAALWCFAGGVSTSPSALYYNGTPSAGVANGSEDAFWTALFPRGNNQTGGTLYFSAMESTNAADPGTLLSYGTVHVPSSGLVCSNPTAPLTLGLRATPISDGYAVQWSYPGGQSAFLRNFSIVATPTSGPSTVVPIPAPPSPSGVRFGTITGLASGTPYTVYVRGTQVDGRPGPSSPSGISALPTDGPLNVSLAASSDTLVQPADSDTFTATATGGAGPYSFEFELANGTVAWVYGQLSSAVLSHTFPKVFGLVRITVRANDSVGDLSSIASVFVLLQATPQGVVLSLSTGDDLVGLSWPTPSSPTAPVLRYAVFYSQSPTALSVFTAGWPDNSTAAQPVLVWNTTHTQFNFSAVNGAPIFVEVVAFNAWGGGLAPVDGPSYGVSSPFALVGFGPSPGSSFGGAAPFTASLSASTSQGIDNNLSLAIYSVSEISPVARPLYLSVPAASADVSAGLTTWGWANATVVFNGTGTYLLQVHLEDAMGDPSLIPSVELYVGTGVAPTVAVTLSSQTPIPFAGTPVDFTGSASGTPGPYTYSWQFGDGSSSDDAGPTPSHRYAIAGSYTAVLTVTDNVTGGSASVSRLVNVNAYPIVRISASEGTGGALSWTFQAIEIGGSGPPEIAWMFGDGTSGSGQGASHTYANPGEYTVKVTIADPAGIPSASSNITIYAGVGRGTQSFAQSAAALGLILLLSVGLLVLAILTFLFYRKARPPPRSQEVDPSTYPRDRNAPPKDPVE